MAGRSIPGAGFPPSNPDKRGAGASRRGNKTQPLPSKHSSPRDGDVASLPGNSGGGLDSSYDPTSRRVKGKNQTTDIHGGY
jgi:hypothetical protein